MWQEQQRETGPDYQAEKHKGFAPDAELVIVKGEVNGGFQVRMLSMP